MSQLFSQLDESARAAALDHARALHGVDLSADEGPRWLVTPLSGARHLLGDGPASAVLERATDESGEEEWVLISHDNTAGAEVRVSGVPVGTGLRVLRHGDELQLVGAPRTFFSDESLSTIEPYVGPAGARCPRCQLEIEIGDDAVRCPGCRVWHHQSAANELLCWTYTPICALCDRETDLQGELEWVPDEVHGRG